MDISKTKVIHLAVVEMMKNSLEASTDEGFQKSARELLEKEA